MCTAEAEYVALGEGVKEALFTGAALSFICPDLSGSCDRVFRIIRWPQLWRTLLVILGPSTLAYGFRFVREILRAKKIDIQFVASKGHHADVLTNALAVTPFKFHRNFLLYLPLEGG